MEQALRRLEKKLTDHPLVDSVDSCFYYFKVVWKSGIKERLVINKYENNEWKLNSYRRSPVWRPQFLPRVLWWEELSDGTKPTPSYLDGVNELDDDVEQYSNLINWKWSEYKACGFYERLITTHEILQYVIEHEWKKQIFPENILNNSLQMVYNESLLPYKTKIGYKLRTYAGKERPAEKLLQHFMPYDYYGKNDPSYYLRARTLPQIRRIYRAIRNVIDTNKRREKKGRKQFLDFNYINLLKCMRKKRTSYKIKPYAFKQIGLYRTLLKKLELNNKTFYDIDPLLGEKFMSATAEQCPYYYKETAPFDVKSKKLSEFMSGECHVDEDDHYDFTIFDNGMKFDKEVIEASWEIIKTKVDMGIIFIHNHYLDEWLENNPGPIERINMKTGKNPADNGEWLVYYF